MGESEGGATLAGAATYTPPRTSICREWICLSLVLLILGVLLRESVIKLQRVDPAFDASKLLVFRIPVPEVSYGKYVYGEKNAPREKLYKQLEQLLSTVPGVESVEFTAALRLQ